MLPPTARALSCRCPPGSQPGAEQLRPVLRPQPLSQLSLGWGWAAGEQLQGGVGGGRAGLGCPQEQPEIVSVPRRGLHGARGGRGLGGWSAPPPLPQCIWQGQLRAPQTPDQSPPWASKGTLAGGAARNSAPQAPHPRVCLSVSLSAETPRSNLTSGPCSHPPTHTLSWLPVPFPQTFILSHLRVGENP